ncbi:hypothetical protein J2766_000240 [Agrobacterium tumefaciens]|uniref:Uncharacterized protein n=1 Tax=Agrobacterium tumefaciens TaxID=358 RepID=A0AAW8LU20_AGRTU|nr:hypothetical protein [Agrobacterium tumefaciens]MBP2563681.1 hypothetical protein [Agrobacterium tumefaciens]MDR6702456.1 hypothetical protein [Agrobacterium tumefaciens]
MTIRVFDLPATMETIHHETLQRALGLLSDVVEAELDDTAVASVARFYMSAFDQWERSKEWRGKVFPCRD